jgi:hypothetical protein
MLDMSDLMVLRGRCDRTQKGATDGGFEISSAAAGQGNGDGETHEPAHVAHRGDPAERCRESESDPTSCSSGLS